MIFFHCFLHFFVSPFPTYFFHWIAVGFVFFSGIIAGKVVCRQKSVIKIILRALKLLLMFIFFNFPVWIKFNFPIKEIAKSFLVGLPEVSIFEILVPITATILFSPLVFQIKQKNFFAIIIFLIIFLNDVGHLFGFFNPFCFFLRFFLIGILGILVAENFLEILSKFFFLFFLSVSVFFPKLWSMQILFCCLLFVGIKKIFSTKKLLTGKNPLEILGIFSLPIYFFHVILIWFLSRFWQGKFWETFLLATVITIMSFLFGIFLQQAQKKSAKFKRIFSLIFK